MGPRLSDLHREAASRTVVGGGDNTGRRDPADEVGSPIAMHSLQIGGAADDLPWVAPELFEEHRLDEPDLACIERALLPARADPANGSGVRSSRHRRSGQPSPPPVSPGGEEVLNEKALA